MKTEEVIKGKLEELKEEKIKHSEKDCNEYIKKLKDSDLPHRKDMWWRKNDEYITKIRILKWVLK